MAAVIPGVDGRHRWEGALSLNRLVDEDAVPVWPRYKVRKIANWRGRADGESAADKAFGRPGSIPRPSSAAGKTVVYSGLTQARTMADLREAESELSAAFAAREVGRMEVDPDYGAPGAGPSYYFDAEPVAVDTDEEQAASQMRASRGHERAFLVGLRMRDPHFYEAAPVVITTGDITSGAGLTYPLVYPVTYPDPGATFGAVTVTNPGSADADPIIDLHGPVRNPAIVNDSLPALLYLPGLRIPSGEFLRLDFATREVLLNGIADYSDYLDSTVSSWWYAGVPGLLGTKPGRPGINQLRMTGEDMSPPAYAEVTVRLRHH